MTFYSQSTFVCLLAQLLKKVKEKFIVYFEDIFRIIIWSKAVVIKLSCLKYPTENYLVLA